MWKGTKDMCVMTTDYGIAGKAQREFSLIFPGSRRDEAPYSKPFEKNASHYMFFKALMHRIVCASHYMLKGCFWVKRKFGYSKVLEKKDWKLDTMAKKEWSCGMYLKAHQFIELCRDEPFIRFAFKNSAFDRNSEPASNKRCNCNQKGTFYLLICERSCPDSPQHSIDTSRQSKRADFQDHSVEKPCWNSRKGFAITILIALLRKNERTLVGENSWGHTVLERREEAAALKENDRAKSFKDSTDDQASETMEQCSHHASQHSQQKGVPSHAS